MDYQINRSIVSVRLQVDYAQQHGMSLESCLQNTNILTEQLTNAYYEITPNQELEVIRNIHNQLSPTFLHAYLLGTQYHLTSYGIWGFALTACENIKEAIQVALEYIDLTFAFSEIQFVQTEDAGVFTFSNLFIPEDVKQFITIRDMVAFLNIQSEILQQELIAEHIELAFPEPDIDISLITSTIKCPITFNADANRVHFSTDFLSMNLPQANEMTAQICKAQCRELLDRRRQHGSFITKIESILRTRQPIPTMDEIAEELHITTRTLHRQLKTRETNWRSILDKVRSDLCLEMIQQGEKNWGNISERLGYSDTSNFIHAFKRWHGKTPSQYVKSKVY